MANFIPPANGASQGNYFLKKIPKITVFEAKTGLQKLRRQPKLQNFLKWFPFLNSCGIKLKILEKRFRGLVHNSRNIADLATSLLASLAGDKKMRLCLYMSPPATFTVFPVHSIL